MQKMCPNFSLPSQALHPACPPLLQMHKVVTQLNDLRVERDLHGTRANGADAAKAELHQELVEACRRLSEMHNRCTVLEVENATLVTHNRELDEAMRGAQAEIEARRRFVEEIGHQLVSSDKAMAEKSEIASRIPGSASGTVSHEEMPREATWQAMQVVLSERVTGCIVAREALVRLVLDTEGKLETASAEINRLKIQSAESVEKAAKDAEERVQGANRSHEHARAMHSEECNRRIQASVDEVAAVNRAAFHKEEQYKQEMEMVKEQHERTMAPLRKQLGDTEAENRRNMERIASFDHCNGENSRLIQVRRSCVKHIVGDMVHDLIVHAMVHAMVYAIGFLHRLSRRGPENLKLQWTE